MSVTHSEIDRRGFLKQSAAGLTFAFALSLDPHGLIGRAAAATAPLATAWVTIARDGAVIIVSPAFELGQGTFTALAAILADELDADWAHVAITQPTEWDEAIYGNALRRGRISSGASMGIAGYFQPVRIAGAQMRRVLLDAVAAQWSVPVAELSTEPSVVVHQASARRMSYGEIAGFATVPAELPAIADADLKSPERWRYIGKDVPRFEVPLKVTGEAQYGIDVQVPGMVYAAVLHVPYHGGAPLEIDDAAARQVPGVTDVVRLPEGVGVVGTSVEATQRAKTLLNVTWTDAPSATYDSDRMLESWGAIARDKSLTGVPDGPVGDARVAMAGAARIFRGEYRTAYVSHQGMEPINATASVSADGKSADIWASSQTSSDILDQLAELLETDRSNIEFHSYLVGGGFGRRGNEQDVVIEAVLLSRAVGKPVKLIYSREEDVAFGKFRPMTAHHIEAGFDAGGKLTAWHHRLVSESIDTFRGNPRGNATERVIMFMTPLVHYAIPNKLAEHVVQPNMARLSTLRGVGVGHNAFAIESFLDEIAKEMGKDSLAFRLELAEGNPRLQTLLHTVAEMSDWTRPREGRALGLGVQEKVATLAVGVAEVSVDRSTGEIKVHNFWAAIDAGLAVQPQNLAYQTEGGIVWGLGHTLREKITIKDGRVQQSNYTDYRVARMSDVPNIEVRVISTDNPPTGGGEDGVGLVACAVGNGVAALTGVRLREIPFGSDLVRSALGA